MQHDSIDIGPERHSASPATSLASGFPDLSMAFPTLPPILSHIHCV